MKIKEEARRMKLASPLLAATTGEERNNALAAIAAGLRRSSADIFAANHLDLARAKENGISAAVMKRLKFDEGKLEGVLEGIDQLISLPDPIGTVQIARDLDEGLTLYRTSCPIGVIGVIFESRPDALVQISSLTVKSGNAALLKGGREALRTNQSLIRSVRKALERAALPADAAQLLETREDVAAMLKQDAFIDLIIPRGSNAFVRYIMENSRIPVLGHSDGICHVYVDAAADLEMALKVALDSKVQNLSVCNAEETLLVHERIAGSFLPRFAELLRENKVEIRGDDAVRKLIACLPASEEDWKTEYLDAILSIRIVPSLEAAVDHINRYGSHHTDCIVTEDDAAASFFLNRVDSAGVYRNVSTRFADGFVYGFGAEVGIATGKLHSRGPMGLDGLTTYKYKLLGNGQTMAEMKSGVRKYTHRVLPESCPL